jgi:hypothetical protein
MKPQYLFEPKHIEGCIRPQYLAEPQHIEGCIDRMWILHPAVCRLVRIVFIAAKETLRFFLSAKHFRHHRITLNSHLTCSTCLTYLM